MKTDHIPDDWTIEKRQGRIYVYDPDGRPRCGAKKRTDGKPCRISPEANGRCAQFHNGKAVMGIAHPSYTHGKSSRVRRDLPERLRKMYDEHDLDVDNLDPDIRLIDTRVADLLRRLQKGDYAVNFRTMNALYKSADEALKTRDMADFAARWAELGKYIRQGSTDYALWDEIAKLTNQRSRLVERKMSIYTKSQQSVRLDEFLYIMGQLERTLITAVELPTVQQRKRAIGNAIRELVARDTQ